MLARRGNTLFDVFDNLLDWPMRPWDDSIITREDPVSVTVDEDTSNMYVRAVVPGFSEDEIRVNVTDNRLSVSGKKETSEETQNRFSSSRMSFERSYTLPNTVIPEKVDAELKNGILLVTVPKKSTASIEAREVPIKKLEEGKT